jgi:glycosyltransferase involved in cell wall biosynthesis
MASGRPVIAYNSGGATETIIDNVTGKFFNDQTWEDLANTVIHFNPYKFNPETISGHASKFNKKVFQEKIKNFINNLN